MNKNAGVNDNGISLKRILVSGVIGLVTVVSLLIITSLLINRRLLPEGRADIYGIVCLFLGSAIGGIVSAGKNKSGKATHAIFSAIVIFAVLLLAGAFIKDSKVFGIKTLINAVCIFMGSVCGCLLTIKQKKRARKRI